VRVLLDATAIPTDLGGVGRYVVELIPELAAAGLDLTVVTRPELVNQIGARAGSARVLPSGTVTDFRPGRFAWEQVGLPRLARAVHADVLHSPHYTMPAAVGAARVVTVHDATFFSDPGAHAALKRVVFRRAIRRAMARADAVVVPSQATADEVMHYAGGDAGRIHVAPHGVDRSVFHPVAPDECARVAVTLGLDGAPYVAFLGTLEPRKNVPALVAGWQQAVAGMSRPPVLVLAGTLGWDAEVAAAVAAAPPPLRVVLPGYVPLENLAGLLSGAVAVVYPSRGEGFGLPVLEAMACGAPVLTTRALSLPEVGGDAVAYCEPEVGSIGTALRALLTDGGLRARLSTAGVARAEKFTWARSAQAHVRAYEAASAHRGSR